MRSNDPRLKALANIVGLFDCDLPGMADVPTLETLNDPPVGSGTTSGELAEQLLALAAIVDCLAWWRASLRRVEHGWMWPSG